MQDSPFSDPDMIAALYQDPQNEILLAEYALATGGIQLGLLSAGGGQSNPEVGDGIDRITQIEGISGPQQGHVGGGYPDQPGGGT